MKKISLKVLTLVAVLTTAGLVVADTNEATLSQIAGYRQWTRINPQPFEVVTDLASVAI